MGTTSTDLNTSRVINRSWQLEHYYKMVNNKNSVMDTVWVLNLVLVDQVEAAATGPRLLNVRNVAPARVPMNPSPSPQSSPAGARPSAPSVPPSGTSVLPQRKTTTPSVPVLRRAGITPAYRRTPACRRTPVSYPHLNIKLI